MSWGWSGNLGYPLPPAWSYDQICNYALPGTSGHTSNGLNMEIDKNVQSSRANPVGKFDILVPPLVGGAFDRFYWMVTHLTVLAEITGYNIGANDQAHTVLYYIQGKDSEYLTYKFIAYLPPPMGIATAFYNGFPGWATAQESSVAETDFIGSFTVPGGTNVTTPHLAVTARGYLKYGRPSMRDANTLTQKSFSFDDLIGDVDGYLIGSLLNDNLNRHLDDVVREVRASIAADPLWRYSALSLWTLPSGSLLEG